MMIVRNSAYLRKIIEIIMRVRACEKKYIAIQDVRPKSEGELIDKMNIQKELADAQAELQEYIDYEVELCNIYLHIKLDWFAMREALSKAKRDYKNKRAMLEKTVNFDKDTSNWFNDFLQCFFTLILDTSKQFTQPGDPAELVMQLVNDFVIDDDKSNDLKASHKA